MNLHLYDIESHDITRHDRSLKMSKQKLCVRGCKLLHMDYLALEKSEIDMLMIYLQ